MVVIDGDFLHSPWMNILFTVLFIGLLSAQCPNAHQFQSTVRSRDLLISIALWRGRDWRFLCVGVKKLLFRISICLAYMFPTFGFIWRHHPWKMTGSISELSSFYRLLCTVTILKQQTKINPNVIQFKLW